MLGSIPLSLHIRNRRRKEVESQDALDFEKSSSVGFEDLPRHSVDLVRRLFLLRKAESRGKQGRARASERERESGVRRWKKRVTSRQSAQVGEKRAGSRGSGGWVHLLE